MRKNWSQLLVRLSEDLDYLDAASQVWCSTSKNNFLEKNPIISLGETPEKLHNLHFCGN